MPLRPVLIVAFAGQFDIGRIGVVDRRDPDLNRLGLPAPHPAGVSLVRVFARLRLCVGIV